MRGTWLVALAVGSTVACSSSPPGIVVDSPPKGYVAPVGTAVGGMCGAKEYVPDPDGTWVACVGGTWEYTTSDPALVPGYVLIAWHSEPLITADAGDDGADGGGGEGGEGGGRGDSSPPVDSGGSAVDGEGG